MELTTILNYNYVDKRGFFFMANENHDKIGRFTSGPNQAGGVSYEERVKKSLGISTPKNHDEKGHIVIDEGAHKGERFDSEKDFKDTVSVEEQELKDYIMNTYKSLGVDSEKYNEDWYNKLPEETKQMWKKSLDKKKANEELERVYSQPENKALIIANCRKTLPAEMSNKLSDEEIWETLDLDRKKALFGGK